MLSFAYFVCTLCALLGAARQEPAPSTLFVETNVGLLTIAWVDGVATLSERAPGQKLEARAEDAPSPWSSESLEPTDEGVFLFDRETGLRRPHPRFGRERHIASIAVDSASHRIAYVQKDAATGLANGVRFANPNGGFELADVFVRRVRWATASVPTADGAPSTAPARPAPEPKEGSAARLAFGSCADEDAGTARVWRLLGALAPDMLVLLGDTPYIDSIDLEVQRRRHREFAAFPPFMELAQHTPFVATWDDHDFGRNDTDGLLAGKENARRAFVEARPGPSYGEGGEGLYTSFRRGPVEVFLLDTRWFARTAPSEFDAAEPTLLGAAQWRWLRAGLLASTAPFKLLACGMIWNGAVRPGKTDHWGAYPAEWGGLCDFLGAHDITGIVLVGGDIHRSRVVEHDTTARVGYSLTELISSPMHDRIIEAANAPHPGLRWDTGTGNTVCIVAATEDVLRATFHTSSGETLHSLALPASALGRR